MTLDLALTLSMANDYAVRQMHHWAGRVAVGRWRWLRYHPLGIQKTESRLNVREIISNNVP
jgi:hypothetical protein